MSQPLYIFDLDGTLALIEHRRHFVEGKVKDWPSFFAACVDDAPNKSVIDTLNRLSRHGGAEVRIWSGRSDEVRSQTLGWLIKHNCVADLTMRKAGDHQPDETLKAAWLDGLPAEDRSRLVAIFDDRDRVVAMWRGKGVTCFQVAPGAF